MNGGKYVLLYSPEAALWRSPNRALSNDAVEVDYCCLGDESEYGPWKDWYKWYDAFVVGYITDLDQVIYCSPLPEF